MYTWLHYATLFTRNIGMWVHKSFAVGSQENITSIKVRKHEQQQNNYRKMCMQHWQVASTPWSWYLVVRAIALKYFVKILNNNIKKLHMYPCSSQHTVNIFLRTHLCFVATCAMPQMATIRYTIGKSNGTKHSCVSHLANLRTSCPWAMCSRHYNSNNMVGTTSVRLVISCTWLLPTAARVCVCVCVRSVRFLISNATSHLIKVSQSGNCLRSERSIRFASMLPPASAHQVASCVCV